VRALGGLQELPFTPEDDKRMKDLLECSCLAVECENSLWRAKLMPDFGAELKPRKRLGGEPGLRKSAVLPTIIIKEEDREPILQWRRKNRIPIHIWHAFFDEAYGISLDRAEELIGGGQIAPTEQVFQAPGGATTKKVIYKIYYLYAYHLATTVKEPKLVADSLTDKNGHILPYVRFEGGSAHLTDEALSVLRRLA
jgi:hypothetical protein